MTPTIFDPPSRQKLIARLRTVDPAREPVWGSLSAVRMVGHLTAGLRAGLGEIEGKPIPGPLSHWPLNQLVMHVLPWPKGAPTSPELLPETKGWEPACADLGAALERFAARRDESYARHVLFGAISANDWGRLMHRHIDHHLRQFGA